MSHARNLLVVRQGLFGDLLFISGVIAELKRQHPQLTVTLMCHQRYHGVFRETLAIDGVVPHRWFSFHHLFRYDRLVFLDGAIECDANARKMNIYDFLAGRYFGISMPSQARLSVVSSSPDLRSTLLARLPLFANAKLRIGLQQFSGSPVRTPHDRFWQRVAGTMLSQYPDATLFIIAEGSKQTAAETLATTINALFSKQRAVSLAGAAQNAEELVALVSILDGVIAPDSAVLHLASAFFIPAIGVFGPFPSKLRIGNSPFAYSIDAPSPCAPCFTHGHWPCREAKKAGVVNSPCFETISTDTIEAAVGITLQRVLKNAEDRERSNETG